MQIITNHVGEAVLHELSIAVEVKVAMAFFCPDEQLLARLLAIPRLTVVISEEFTVNNPYSIEKLLGATIRTIPTDSEHGKLHAKVIIVTRHDGSRWALVGSANMTGRGMFSNQEACVAVDDEGSIRHLEDWFDNLFLHARSPNLSEAKQIFDTRSFYRIEPRP